MLKGCSRELDEFLIGRIFKLFKILSYVFKKVKDWLIKE